MERTRTYLTALSHLEGLNLNLDNEKYFKSKEMVIWRDGALRASRYYPFCNLSNTRELVFSIVDGYGREYFPLPGALVNRLAAFLRGEGYDPSTADCKRFAYYLTGLPYYDRFDTNQWDSTAYLNDSYLSPGNAILISNRQENDIYPKHMAIYLTDGLYISKFGVGIGNNLIVATLDEMCKGFEGNYVSILEPKRE
ncbi:hypothetical protein M1555_01320 [Patescibacteria group bacterium]|nr:hypothetical protein [Patescibacteria group bacterium]